MDQNVEFSDNFPDYLMDAQYLLHPQEIKSIDKDVRKVIYRNAVAQKIFDTKQIARGKREHRVSVAVQPSSPIFSEDFLPESMDKVAKEEKTFYLVGISKDYFLSMVDIDASRNSQYHQTKIDTLHLREMVALVAEFRERVLWRGQDINDAPSISQINSSLEGIVNATGINTFDADGDGTAQLGTAGDGIKGFNEACSALIVDKFSPPFDTVMSPYVFTQLISNMNSTTHVTDMERIKGLTDNHDRQMVNRIEIHEALLNADDDGSASAWAVVAPHTKSGEATVQILESYPLWHYPINTSKLGIQGKVLTMVGTAVIRPEAIAFEDSIDVDGTA